VPSSLIGVRGTGACGCPRRVRLACSSGRDAMLTRGERASCARCSVLARPAAARRAYAARGGWQAGAPHSPGRPRLVCTHPGPHLQPASSRLCCSLLLQPASEHRLQSSLPANASEVRATPALAHRRTDRPQTPPLTPPAPGTTQLLQRRHLACQAWPPAGTGRPEPAPAARLGTNPRRGWSAAAALPGAAAGARRRQVQPLQSCQQSQGPGV
jgi:hypothetical protein